MNLKLNDKLTDTIVEGNKFKNEEHSKKLIDVLEEMWNDDTWISLPMFHDEGTDERYIKFFIVPEHEDFGDFMVFYSNPKFLNNVFGTDLTYISIRKVFDMMMNFGEQCNGFIINPATDCQVVISRPSIIDIVNRYSNK